MAAKRINYRVLNGSGNRNRNLKEKNGKKQAYNIGECKSKGYWWRRWHRPVSYTHLDVYKRQELSLLYTTIEKIIPIILRSE